MFDRILVPTDGSHLGDVALEVGRHIAEREHAKLVLVRVEPERAPLGDALAATASLEQQAAALRNMGDAASYRVVYGRPEEGIALVAAEEACGLIVLSHHHRGVVEGLRHPSVTSRMLSRAPAPVLIWPEAVPARAVEEMLMTPNAVVVAPVDGSEEAERALPLAAELARSYGRPLMLVEVLVPTPVTTAAGPYFVDIGTHHDEEQEAREYLAKLRTYLADEASLQVQSMLLAGDPAEEILRVASAHEGGVIVMGTHGRTGIGKLMLGSVASRVMERATTPVLVTPPLRPARAEEPVGQKTDQREREFAGGFTPMF